MQQCCSFQDNEKETGDNTTSNTYVHAHTHTHTQGETIFVHKLSIASFLVKKQVENITEHMSYHFKFTRYTSPSNDASYQMMKTWVPRSYNRCLKWPPSILRHIAVHHTAFHQTYFNMMASTAITTA
jgi:hypothetical protein